MYEPNLERVLAFIQPSDVVLDIGGWGRPFNRANHVIDAEPFDTRLAVRAQGGDRECFTKGSRSPMSSTVTGAFPFHKAFCGGCRCRGISKGCSGKVRLRSLNGGLLPSRWN
ncbi:MAG: hypothetical protein AAB676_04710 [Verrucomicrobiota bacterium]